MSRWNLLEKFDFRKSSERAGIEYLVGLGLVGDQIAGIQGLSEQDMIEQSAEFAKTYLPFSNMRRDNFMRNICTRLLENFEFYKEVCQGLEDIENVSKYAHQVPELKFTKRLVYNRLLDDSKIVLGLTFPKMKDPRPLVLNKPYVFDQNTGFYDPSGGGKSE